MSKLFFRYGAMNSGKSTAMLQVAHNYEERDQSVVLMKSSVDTKGDDQIVSRLGVTRRADLLLSSGQDLRVALQKLLGERDDLQRGVACVLIDEAQFLTLGTGGSGVGDRSARRHPRGCLRYSNRFSNPRISG